MFDFDVVTGPTQPPQPQAAEAASAPKSHSPEVHPAGSRQAESGPATAGAQPS